MKPQIKHHATLEFPSQISIGRKKKLALVTGAVGFEHDSTLSWRLHKVEVSGIDMLGVISNPAVYRLSRELLALYVEQHKPFGLPRLTIHPVLHSEVERTLWG